MSTRENLVVAVIVIFAFVGAPVVMLFSPLLAEWLHPLLAPAGWLALGSFGAWWLWLILSKDLWPALCRFGNWLGRP